MKSIFQWQMCFMGSCRLRRNDCDCVGIRTESCGFMIPLWMCLPSVPYMHIRLLNISICELHSGCFVPVLSVRQFFMVSVVVNRILSSPSLKVKAPPQTHPVQSVLDQGCNCVTLNHGGWVGIIFIIILCIGPRAYRDLISVGWNGTLTCVLNRSQYRTC
jgi:type IV secretory pathway VirB2 component (pilin)